MQRQIKFESTADLADVLRTAESAHAEFERTTGIRDANWAVWYARYIADTYATPSIGVGLEEE
jgi:hypothetical protein